jgi:hypothetical protein
LLFRFPKRLPAVEVEADPNGAEAVAEGLLFRFPKRLPAVEVEVDPNGAEVLSGRLLFGIPKLEPDVGAEAVPNDELNNPPLGFLSGFSTPGGLGDGALDAVLPGISAVNADDPLLGFVITVPVSGSLEVVASGTLDGPVLSGLGAAALPL